MNDKINANFTEKTEEEFILQLKEKIYATILDTAGKVNSSALNFMNKQKNWISTENLSEANKFFTNKIPQVLADELSKKLASTLNLD